MGPNGPVKHPHATPTEPEADGPASTREDTQPISRRALGDLESTTADTGPPPPEQTDTIDRSALFGHASDTEPLLRAAAPVEPDEPAHPPHAMTMAPVRASYGIEDVRENFARGDFDAAYAIAEAILAYDSSNDEARSYASSCELRLRRRYAARIGSMRRVPRVAARAGSASPVVDDHGRALLARVDGRLTTEELLRASGLPEMDALRIFVALLDGGLVTLD